MITFLHYNHASHTVHQNYSLSSLLQYSRRCSCMTGVCVLKPLDLAPVIAVVNGYHVRRTRPSRPSRVHCENVVQCYDPFATTHATGGSTAAAGTTST